MVIRSMMDIKYCISSVSVVSLMIPKIVSISSIMCFHLFSQYSSRMRVRVNPKFKIASSHLKCKAELTSGTCSVRLTLKDFWVERVCSHFLR